MAKKTETKTAHKVEKKLRPRVTEKAAISAEKRHVYVFNVEKTDTKNTLKEALKNEFKVTPLKIHFATVPSKRKFVRGKWGVKKGGKKAYVYLKEGDKIDII